MSSRNPIQDTQQSYWQMAAIQLSGWTSLPILATSLLVLQTNSFLGAALTIFVGNAILWFLRLGIVAMSHDRRQSTLDLAQEYFGKLGGYVVAALLLISTFVWFLVQTTAASNVLTHLVSIHEDPGINQFVQISVLLGLASTLLCMEGIGLLRRLAVVAFPVLCVVFVVILIYLPHMPVKNENALSLSGLSLVLAMNLGVTADMPTFFRHSRSWGDSIRALTITQVVSLVLGLASLYLGSLISGMFEINQSLLAQHHHDVLRYALIAFIFISAVCANVANVYSASVGWELVAPSSLIGRQEYLILGLSLTMLYILLGNVFSPLAVLHISDSALVNLSLVLVLAYMLGSHGQLPSASQRQGYFIAWALATVLNAVQMIYNPGQLSSLFVSAIVIVVVVGIGRLRRAVG